MAVIQFTDADKLASKVMEKGGGKAILVELEQKASTSQKSVNFWGTFRIVEGPFMGKELKCCFNTETRNASLLGTMKFFPHRDLMKIKGAIEGKTINDIDFNIPLDTNTLLNKPFDLLWDITAAEGDLINVIINFLPLGMAAVQVQVPF